MQKIIKPRSHTIGLPPGSLVHIGEKKRDSVRITLIEYSEETFSQKEIKPDKLSCLKTYNKTVKWVNIEGLSQVEILAEIGEIFNIHALVLEDILSTDQRPKIEIYDQYIFLSAKMLLYDTEEGELNIEQISFILGENYILSFSERDTDIFEPVIRRLQQGMGRIRKMGPDYLAYCLLDVVVDNYFEVQEKISEEIEMTEDKMVIHTSDRINRMIYKLKRQVLFLHKSVWPLRDVLSALRRGESLLIKDSTEIYLGDLYDHVVQIMDTTETLRDILSSMLDVYLSSMSNKMNEIMKVLTIISTVFMPLSFIVGVYGMNLTNMPELGWIWMYPFLWAIMISIAAAMLIYFKKKKWW